MSIGDRPPRGPADEPATKRRRGPVITAAEVQEWVTPELTFDALETSRLCDGDRCLESKLRHHRARRGGHFAYQAHLLEELVTRIDCPDLERGHLLVEVPGDGRPWVGAYTNIGRPFLDPALGRGCWMLIHVEVVGPDDGEPHHFVVLYDRPRGRAAAVAIHTHSRVFRRVPWVPLLRQIPWRPRPDCPGTLVPATPEEPPVIPPPAPPPTPPEDTPGGTDPAGTTAYLSPAKLTHPLPQEADDGEDPDDEPSDDSSDSDDDGCAGAGCGVTLINARTAQRGNPMRYLMGLHGVLSTAGAALEADPTAWVDPVESLIRLGANLQRAHSPHWRQLTQRALPRLRGVAMYELRMVDAFVPRDREALRQVLGETGRARRLRVLDPYSVLLGPGRPSFSELA